MTESFTREQVLRWIVLAESTIDASILEDKEVERTMKHCLASGDTTFSQDGVRVLLEECLTTVEARYENLTKIEDVRDRMNVIAAVFGYLRDNPQDEDSIFTADTLYDAFFQNWSEPGPDNTYITDVLASDEVYEEVAGRWLAEAYGASSSEE